MCVNTVKTVPHESVAEIVTGRHLYWLFIYIYSLLIEEDIFDRQNISVKLPCVYVCLSSGYLFIFKIFFLSFFLSVTKFNQINSSSLEGCKRAIVPWSK